MFLELGFALCAGITIGICVNAFFIGSKFDERIDK